MSVTLFYEAMRCTPSVTVQGVKGTWEKEPSVAIDDKQWKDIFRISFSL